MNITKNEINLERNSSTYIYYDINNKISSIKVSRSFPNKMENIIKAHDEVNEELTNLYKIIEILLLTGQVLMDKNNGVYEVVSKSSDSSILLEIDLNKSSEVEIFRMCKDIINLLINKKIKKNILSYFFSPKFAIYMNDDETLIKQLNNIEELGVFERGSILRKRLSDKKKDVIKSK